MEYLEVSKFVTSIAVAIVTVLSRYIYTLLTRSGEKMKIRSSSVELIDKVINEREWKKQENRLVVEETFEQLYSKPLTFHEIKVLIYSETPNAAFRTYLKYRPAIEINENKTKFRFKKGKRPYWFIFNRTIRIPNKITQEIIAYSAFGFPASYAMTWLLSDASAALGTKNLAILWLLDGLVWLLAIIFLVVGLKYQDREKEITRDLGDKFQINNQAN
ncbi:hypothetical protein ACK32U_15075 [Aeromonas dhakensis]|uniref:hypothetical protein n=1 Tax=Aeromonas dhakensis TaxID=196024 RepID=UPI0039894140